MGELLEVMWRAFAFLTLIWLSLLYIYMVARYAGNGFFAAKLKYQLAFIESVKSHQEGDSEHAS